MEMITLAILAGIAAALVIYALLPGKSDDRDIVKRRSAGLTADEDKASVQSKARARANQSSVFAAAIPLLVKPVMPTNEAEQTTLRAKLLSAGFRRESAAAMFLASKSAGGLLCAMLASFYAISADKPTSTIIYFAVFGLGVGFIGPNFWLSMAIKKRTEAVRNGLPDSLDLMVVAVEAGLGLDAALQRVSDEMRTVHHDLSEEVQIAVIETQMGTTRAEALSKMADRTAVQEMRSLVAVIIQAEKLGTSIARALRNQAESLRTKRRQKAEERAQKTAVKLLIPLILFIFPAIFVVLAGPAAIHLMHTFSDGALSK
ncbi:MAG TPA: type II secretion system F family protein [Phycisphaerae bacterium]|nr:type II secretion system F family protein [Phycisphaerae bacterium]